MNTWIIVISMTLFSKNKHLITETYVTIINAKLQDICEIKLYIHKIKP